MKFLLIFISICILLFTCSSQIAYAYTDTTSYPKFENITADNGLSNNVITSILKDKYGYMWFGTVFGLNKYDGITFKTYRSETNTKGSISSSRVNSIYDTRNHELWIGTGYGLDIFDRTTETFTTYLHDSVDPDSISNDYINKVFEDSQGNLWVGTAYGLNIFDRTTKKFTSYLNDLNNPDSISSDYILTIFEDSQGNLWVGTAYGLNIFDRTTKKFTSYLNDLNNPDSIGSDYIFTIFEDSQANLWVGTAYGLYIFNRATKTFTTYLNDLEDLDGISHTNVLSICEDENKKLWVGTISGLYRMDVNNNIIISKYLFDNTQKVSIYNRIIALYVDNGGILWVGTANGINKLVLSKSAFTYYSGVLKDAIQGIYSNNNNDLWIITNSYIVKYDSDSNRIISTYTNKFGEANIPKLKFETLCVASNRYVLSATISSGMEVFDTLTNELSTYRAESGNQHSLPSNIITALYTDSNNTVWIGTSEGLCTFNPANGEITQYKDNADYPDSIRNGEVLKINEASDRNMWFTTSSSLYMLDKSTEKINRVIDTTASLRKGPNSSINIQSVYIDSRNKVWIGTDNGLYYFEIGKDGSILQLTEVSLSEVWIVGINEDKKGDMWISTMQGLYRLSRTDNEYTKFENKDGLNSDSFTIACYKTAGGELLFGTLKGLLSFYPDDIRIDMTIPRVIITDFNLINKTISFDKPIEDVTEINLPHSNNSFIVDFVALHYNSPKDNKYAYKLEGFDTEWNYCDATNSFARYTNIPAGKYTFIVKASNSDGVWNEKGIALNILIRNPLWQEWWFILSIVAVVVIIVMLIVRIRTHALAVRTKWLENEVNRRTKQLTQTTEELQEELKSRAEFSRTLAHELKTPLTPLLATSELMLLSKPQEPLLSYAKNINSGAQELNQRISDLLDLSRGQVNALKLNLERVNFKAILEDSVNYDKPIAKANGLTIDTQFSDSLSDACVDAKRIRQIILNLLDNAVKYTPSGGRIIVSAREQEGYIITSISDTGKGISSKDRVTLFQPYTSLSNKSNKKSGLGLGLSLCKMLVELHGGNIWLEESTGKGSTFVFSIPIQIKDSGVTNECSDN